MASIKLCSTKKGPVYEIRVRNGRGGQTYSLRWPVPAGWSQKSIDRELSKVAADFERRVKAGEVQTRKQIKEAARLEALARLKVDTLKQYGEKVFMPYLSMSCAENTRASYQGQLENHIYPAFGELLLSEITAAQINSFLVEKQSSGLSAGSCNKIRQILKQLFKAALDDDTISKNPMERVKKVREPKGEEVKEKEAFSAGDVEYILKCAENEPLQWRIIIYLSAYTGMRRGEVLGIKWNDINFKDGSIHVRRTLCYTQKAGIYTNPPKSGKDRFVFPPAVVFSMLGELRKQRKTEKRAVILGSDLSGFVFQQGGKVDRPIHPQSPNHYFRKFGKKYGINHFHPHKMRHTFASIAITQGADVVSVSDTLGHADTAITLRMYAHASEEGKRRASAIFEKAVADSGGGS